MSIFTKITSDNHFSFFQNFHVHLLSRRHEYYSPQALFHTDQNVCHLTKIVPETDSLCQPIRGLRSPSGVPIHLPPLPSLAPSTVYNSTITSTRHSLIICPTMMRSPGPGTIASGSEDTGIDLFCTSRSAPKVVRTCIFLHRDFASCFPGLPCCTFANNHFETDVTSEPESRSTPAETGFPLLSSYALCSSLACCVISWT